VVLVGHALVQNLRRGHYELAPKSRSLDGCPWRSTSWPWRSDHRSKSRSRRDMSAQRNSASRDLQEGRHHLQEAATPRRIASISGGP
jgi:hypothetical protein